MSKHRPGPWRYWECRVDSSLDPPMYDYAQFANPKEHVFRAPLRYLRDEDARLIAAAPELLEALKNVTVHLIAAHSLLERGGKKAAASDTMFALMLDDYEKSFKIGKAAIAKAEGRA